MRITFFLFAIALTTTFVGCKNSAENSETETTEETTTVLADQTDVTYKGEFIYLADGAVLKGTNFIYGVTLDDMASELADRVAPVKKEEFDMVPVVVKGIISKKEEGAEGWDEIITITEIVAVSDKPAEADIKIEDKKS
ncbi:MAG: hypothetical protein HKN48_09600 [Flavobacteriaceae bacterium]|nr:hypothetical protein [Flavobacteriaceae bacterium]